MNLVKKILIVHGDSVQRRKLVLVLAGAGFDVRAFGSMETAADGASQEWFDLAVVDHNLSGTQGFAFVSSLRKVQPTVPVLMLANEIEFPLVVQGIRQGVADVLPQTGDLRPIVRRVCAFFKQVPSCDQDVSSEELARAEAVLDTLGGVGEVRAAEGAVQPDLSAQLLVAARDKAALEAQLERAVQERAAIEAQLKALLAQNSDLGRLSAEAADLRSQREIVAAAQAAIDEKARALAAQRAELERERDLLHSEKRQLESSHRPRAMDEMAVARERAELTDWQCQLEKQAHDLRAEATRLQQDRARLASERRRWHTDLDVLREQEDNLRHYEARLREWQARLETERVGLIGAQVSGHGSAASPAPSNHATEEALEAAWNKYYRATQLLEADKANFIADKLAVKDLEKTLRAKETALSLREAKLADAERKQREATNARLAAAEQKAAESASTALLSSFTRSPFATAKAIFGSSKRNDS